MDWGLFQEAGDGKFFFFSGGRVNRPYFFFRLDGVKQAAKARKGVRVVETLVIFGATGDLTARKLIPALFALWKEEKLPSSLEIIGIARSPLDDALWREKLRSFAEGFTADFHPLLWKQFEQRLFYISGSVEQEETFCRLDRILSDREKHVLGKGTAQSVRIYYLALAPDQAHWAVEHLINSGMLEQTPNRIRRLILEKPFGTSRKTARIINEILTQKIDESQIFRIDHYLGKETVNNIFVLRFANTVFEPVWNRDYIDHVQITAHESQGVERRGGYYDKTGVLRDMFQNHLLQLTAIAAMEPPKRFDAESIRDEKVKLLRSVRPFFTQPLSDALLLGQYDGYRNEPGVAPDSATATYAALRLEIDNPRWRGVPFYLRSGKKMSCPTTQILIQFKKTAHPLFFSEKALRPDLLTNTANRLLIQIQPAEGIRLAFVAKIPGSGRLRMSELVYSFADEEQVLMSPYERLLLDAFSGDSTFFIRSDEIDEAWRIIDPLAAARIPLFRYQPGGWGPDIAQSWIARTAAAADSAPARRWFDSCPVLRRG